MATALEMEVNREEESKLGFEVFHEEINERTILARAARHHCGAPRKPRINNFTESRWRKMNGEVQSFDFGRPMSWYEFKAMPENLQIEYIQRLVDKYHVGPTALGEMFGVTGTTVSKQIKGVLHMTLPAYMSSKQRETFIRDFCNREPHKEQREIQSNTAAEASPAPQQPHEHVNPMVLTKSTLTFSGPYNAKLMADKLASLYADGINVTITLDIEMMI